MCVHLKEGERESLATVPVILSSQRSLNTHTHLVLLYELSNQSDRCHRGWCTVGIPDTQVAVVVDAVKGQ